MIKEIKITKLASVALLASSLIVGCSVGEMGEGSAAIKAISAAKSENSTAKSVGYEWRDTGKMIKAAEKAAISGDTAKAVKLANSAKEQATAAIAQSKSEAARFNSNHGTSSL